MQMIYQKLTYSRYERDKRFAVARHEYKIVGVSYVVFRFQRMLRKLIKIIHVNVDEDLRGYITEREPYAGPPRCAETVYDALEKPEKLGRGNALSQDSLEDTVVDIRKEFSDIAFEHPCRPQLILRGLSGKCLEAVECPMRSLIKS
jgi:hypothetical protein